VPPRVAAVSCAFLVFLVRVVRLGCDVGRCFLCALSLALVCFRWSRGVPAFGVQLRRVSSTCGVLGVCVVPSVCFRRGLEAVRSCSALASPG